VRTNGRVELLRSGRSAVCQYGRWGIATGACSPCHAAVNAIAQSFVQPDEGNRGMWRGLQLKSPVASPPSPCNPFPPHANALQSLATHPTRSRLPRDRRFPAATMQPAALQLLVSTEDSRVATVPHSGCLLQLPGCNYSCSLRCWKSAGLKWGFDIWHMHVFLY
jgi:hypothetical protein